MYQDNCVSTHKAYFIIAFTTSTTSDKKAKRATRGTAVFNITFRSLEVNPAKQKQ